MNLAVPAPAFCTEKTSGRGFHTASALYGQSTFAHSLGHKATKARAMAPEEIWKTEQGFWLDGPKFYEEHMEPSALMVFPEPVGILKGGDILDGLKGAPRWRTVEMEQKTVLSLGKTLVLAYRATSKRDGDATYEALCSSTYLNSRDAWRLIAHQQTPVT